MTSSMNPSPLSRPAAFLDRDGVINLDIGYPHRIEDLVLTKSAAEGIALLNRSDYRVIVITNQSGVARGLFGMDAVHRFHAHMQARLAERGARIDAFYVAPYHPDGVIPHLAIEHEDRKPGPGMLLRAIRDYAVDIPHSFLIGDKQSDMEAARRAGVRGILVPTDCCDLAAVVRGQIGSDGVA